MFERFKKQNFTTEAQRVFPSVTEHAATHGLTYAASLDRMRAARQIKVGDPRMDIDPVQVRKLSGLSMDDLAKRYQRTLQATMANAPDARTRARLAGLLKAGSENLKIFDEKPRSTTPRAMEKIVGSLSEADPHNRNLKQLVAITAAASDQEQRALVSRGFETGNIAKAAKTQGKTWLEMRDTLSQHGMIKENDPRMKIRKADVDNQKGGQVLRGNTLPAEDLERVAMARLKKNPKDELAFGWLSAAGQMCEAQPARKIKGAEVQGVLPAKKRLFGSKSAARKRAQGIELG